MRYLFPLNPYNQQRQFQKPVWVYPAHLAMYATYLRNEGHEVVWGGKENIFSLEPGAINYFYGTYDKAIKDDFQIDVPFEKLPYPDRIFTDAKNPRWQSYGNYKYHPATHMMASNLCWWGKCTFCIDTEKLKAGEKRGVRSVAHVISEIDDLIRLEFREVFDDSGTFPIQDWLDEFCKEMLKNGRNKKIVWGCNMKPISKKIVPFKLMKEAGCRFILVGVESANQKTIDRIRKGQESEKVIENIKAMSDAGLEVHTTWMSSYPWETLEEEKKTIKLCNYLLRKGYSHTAQASIYMPPRTAPPNTKAEHERIKLYFNAYKHPEYWYNKIKSIRRLEDVTYLIRGAKRSQSFFEDIWRLFCRDQQLK